MHFICETKLPVTPFIKEINPGLGQPQGIASGNRVFGNLIGHIVFPTNHDFHIIVAKSLRLRGYCITLS